jgi:hypothetical protein
VDIDVWRSKYVNDSVISGAKTAGDLSRLFKNFPEFENYPELEKDFLEAVKQKKLNGWCKKRIQCLLDTPNIEQMLFGSQEKYDEACEKFGKNEVIKQMISAYLYSFSERLLTIETEHVKISTDLTLNIKTKESEMENFENNIRKNQNIAASKKQLNTTKKDIVLLNKKMEPYTIARALNIKTLNDYLKKFPLPEKISTLFIDNVKERQRQFNSQEQKTEPKKTQETGNIKKPQKTNIKSKLAALIFKKRGTETPDKSDDEKLVGSKGKFISNKDKTSLGKRGGQIYKVTTVTPPPLNSNLKVAKKFAELTKDEKETIAKRALPELPKKKF